MLNPGLDVDYWVSIAYNHTNFQLDDSMDGNFDELKNIISRYKDKPSSHPSQKTKKIRKIEKLKFANLEEHLKSNIIGQNEAIETISTALIRSQADMHDLNRPLGIFLFAGSSGVGKTHLAKTLHNYLFDANVPMVRIDCGEFQHKHENSKLIGSPPGYVGHDEGGYLVNQIEKNPNSVVLIDEVEKAHPDIWNTFLSIFDEGTIVDAKGKVIDFGGTIIILTTNLGNEKTVDHLIGTGTGFNKNINYIKSTFVLPSKSLVERNTLDAIRKYFRPEFLNRLDKIVVFNHLSRHDCEKIAELEMQLVANKLSKKGFAAEYNTNVINALIEKGIDSVKGARGLSQIRRDQIETGISKIIVQSNVPKGTIFNIDYIEDNFIFSLKKPSKKTKVVE
jgi:ATP-dependent Clp protease ATP-binding subunit ClpA